MEHISADDTWAHESFQEYADHSLDHDNVTDAEVAAAA